MRVFLLLPLLLSTPVFAAYIHTAPLEEVVEHSSHVALVRWLPQQKRFRVTRSYRGAWPDAAFEVHGVPDLVRGYYESRGLGEAISLDWSSPDEPKERVSPTMILFAEEVDGRLHLTGLRRYGKKFGAHASVRMVTREGSVFGFSQVMNPGSPVPCRAAGKTLEGFEKLLADLLAKHLYKPQPGDRPPLPPEHRESFFAAIGDTFDWYQGAPHRDLLGWGVQRTSRATLEATADRLEAWMDSVPKEHRIHGLDTMMILCRKVQGGGADTRAIRRRIHARLDEVDRAQAEAWIVRELRFGDYYVHREALGRTAQRLGPEAWTKARTELENWIERTGANEGGASWRALVTLGDKQRAENARKRREAREAKQPDD